MKQTFKFTTPWLMAALMALAAGAPAMAAPVPALELNGISSFFGSKSACLIYQQPNPLAPHGFMLDVGKSRFGIRLICVDAVSNIVQIENNGQIQFLRLCPAPDRPWPTISPAPGTAEYQELLARYGNDPGQVLLPDASVDISKMNNTALNNPGFSGNGMSTAQKTPADSHDPGMNQNSPSDGNGADARQESPARLNGPNPAAALKDQSSADWYQDSASMEKHRLETAQSVLAGEMDPWPLTPLTPAGTPASLISDDAIYANHLPGFYGN